MKLELANVRLPLAKFALELDATLGARVTGVFGASGAGKTSLLDIIAGLRRPAAGRVALDGETLSDTAKKIFLPPERRGIGTWGRASAALRPIVGSLVVKRGELDGFVGTHGLRTSVSPTSCYLPRVSAPGAGLTGKLIHSCTFRFRHLAPIPERTDMRPCQARSSRNDC